MRQEAGKRDDPPAVGIDSTKLDADRKNKPRLCSFRQVCFAEYG
jgi:hypothetical protein